MAGEGRAMDVTENHGHGDDAHSMVSKGAR